MRRKPNATFHLAGLDFVGDNFHMVTTLYRCGECGHERGENRWVAGGVPETRRWWCPTCAQRDTGEGEP